MPDPIETLYVNNINDKILLRKLRAELNDLFAPYGKVIQITAHKNLKMKGQAFITFDNIESSINAQKSLDNHNLYNKPMRVSFARGNSDNYHLIVEKDESAVDKRKSEKESASKKRENPQSQPKAIKKRKVKDFKEVPPNKTLLLQNTAESSSQDVLEGHFKSFDGFLRVRVIKARSIAFIDFENEELAGKALRAKASHFEPASILSYAKK